MKIPANDILRGHWRVFFQDSIYHATSKGFFTEKKARGFKHYRGIAFGLRSSVRFVK